MRISDWSSDVCSSDLKFVDLFAGCGGLSLGLSLAGMRGLFAIERDGMAFETFSANFVQSSAPPAHRFKWPRWLHQQAWGIDDLLAEHKGDLEKLRGQVDILAGGPPCQGFKLGRASCRERGCKYVKNAVVAGQEK